MFNDSCVESYLLSAYLVNPVVQLLTYFSLFLASVLRIGLIDKEFLCRTILFWPVVSSSMHPIEVILITLMGVAGLRSRPIQFGRPLFVGLSLVFREINESGRMFFPEKNRELVWFDWAEVSNFDLIFEKSFSDDLLVRSNFLLLLWMSRGGSSKNLLPTVLWNVDLNLISLFLYFLWFFGNIWYWPKVLSLISSFSPSNLVLKAVQNPPVNPIEFCFLYSNVIWIINVLDIRTTVNYLV